ncbi:MAG: hypothetical protein AB7N70_37845 [Dehalococcoidia bacterium]
MPDRSAVNLVSQTIEITDVEDIVITETVSHDDGGYVRSIRIFGLPHGTGGPAVCELIVRGTTQAKIAVTSPERDF